MTWTAVYFRSFLMGEWNMKKTRGTRMAAAIGRAAKAKGGKGPVKSRAAGRNIMRT